MAEDPTRSVLDTSRANPARIYDYLLGGAHNFEVDRRAGDQMLPTARQTARVNRGFLRRAVRFLAEQGIDQFLDQGSGIPTVGNVHEIARQTNPSARVVYVDNEPVAVAYAQQLLAEDPQTEMVDADVRDPDAVWRSEAARRLLDPDRPIAVLLAAVLHFVPDADDPAGIVAGYLDRTAPGSCLALSHYTADAWQADQQQDASKAGENYQRNTSTPVVPRTRAELAALVAGLELVPPGITWAQDWRPAAAEEPPATVDDIYALVARRP
jgi:trans-aconitate methyltransferase